MIMHHDYKYEIWLCKINMDYDYARWHVYTDIYYVYKKYVQFDPLPIANHSPDCYYISRRN